MKKVIIHGHKLHSHTHSFIHAAFYKAFKYLGYNVFWMDNSDNTVGFDFSNAIFLTEGQVDEKIPITKDGLYITHNCNADKYPKERTLVLQVYTNDCLQHDMEKIAPCIYYKDRLLHMPWATDLLPSEIEYSPVERTHDVHWIGTIGGGEFGNIKELSRFMEACVLSGVSFKHHSGLSFEENLSMIRKSYMAPAINGTWQVEKGYIPCRIFKNISYGQFGLTNNKVVHELFEGQVVYNADPYDLFYDAKQVIESEDYQPRLINLMNIVKDKHTYINRINTILSVL